MAAIDVGPGAIDRSLTVGGSYTVIDKSNAANASGYLSSFEIWASATLSNFVIGTFSGSGTSWNDRDYETIGSVNSGSKQTFTGKNCDVVSGDLLGYYFPAASGNMERDNVAETPILFVSGNKFGGGSSTYTETSGPVSIYATGAEYAAPTVTTQNASSVTSSGCTGNGNITATGGINATRRGFCYVEGVSGDPTVADSTAYDDGDFGTGAYTKAITGLKFGTGYRVRAYAINSVGTSYGTTVQVTTNAINIIIGEANKVVTAISVLVGGVWKATKPSILVGGVWK